jgi:TniQ
MHVSRTYQLIKEDALLLPKRSTYHHLEPIGIGTSAVESLTSYISRLAAAHRVSVATLYEFTIVPGLNKSYLADQDHLGPASTLNAGFRNQIKNINGVGKVAREWVNLFEKLTLRRDLTRLTFLNWSEVLTPQKLHRNYQAWCPACYEEMRGSNGIIYQPLIWSVQVLKICYRHQVCLVDQCPQCNRQFLGLTRRLCLGFCPKCNYWLGSVVNLPSAECVLSDSQLEWQKFVSNNICGLISFTQYDSLLPSKGNIGKWLQTFADQITNGKMQRLSALLGKSNLTVWEWRHGRVRPLLFELMRICYCMNIRLVELLTGKLLTEKSSFNFRQFPNELEPTKKSRSPRPFDYSKVRPQLEKYLDMSPPVSMSRVATEIGYDRGLLYKYIPDLYCKIRDRYQEFLKSRCRRRRLEREEEVTRACLELYRQGVYLTDSTVADFLSKPSYRGRRDVRAIIVMTRKRLGQTRK